MRRFNSLLVSSLVLTFALPADTRAQAAVQTQSAGPSQPAAVVNSLKDQLRNLVSAQESFYAGKSTYSNSLKELGYVARDGAYIMVFRADNRGWVGRAVHPSLPGKSCVIFVGDSEKHAAAKTDATQLSGAEGAPVCDAP